MPINNARMYIRTMVDTNLQIMIGAFHQIVTLGAFLAGHSIELLAGKSGTTRERVIRFVSRRPTTLMHTCAGVVIVYNSLYHK